jgi:recombination protein RecT
MTAEPRKEQSALVALDAEIERRRDALESSAASLIDPVRMKGVVLAAFTRNPALWECDPITVARAVVESAQYGLEPTGAIGGAHLVPFRNKRTGRKEAQLIIDYRGYIQLARRSGEVSKVWARTVRERDEFHVEAGSEDRIHHRPYLGDEDPGRFTHVYAVIQYRDGSQQFDWDTWAWVETIRKRSRASNDGPWVTDEPEMAKKSIVRRLLKTAPLTVEARRAIEFEEQAEAEVAQHRSGRPSQAVVKIRERLGVAAVIEPEEDAQTDGDDTRTDVPADPAPEDSGSDPAPSVCGIGSPYEDESTCVLEAGHKGNHRNGEAESW